MDRDILLALCAMAKADPGASREVVLINIQVLIGRDIIRELDVLGIAAVRAFVCSCADRNHVHAGLRRRQGDRERRHAAEQSSSMASSVTSATLRTLFMVLSSFLP